MKFLKKPQARTAPSGGLDKATIKRLGSYLKPYRARLIMVVGLVLVSAVASAGSSLFLRTLIDGYIVPLIGTENPDFSGLLGALLRLSALLACGIAASWAYSWTMVSVAQRTLKEIRDEMFEKMQTLPIRYFDTHEHGDTMSLYTNDVDTLRQMLAQTFVQAISSLFTIVAVFVSMLSLSLWLTLLVVLGLVVTLKAVIGVAKKSGPYFVAQQKTLAALDGYIEEIINGQKVVKVFGHEGAARTKMQHLNKEWEEAAALSNGYAMSMMPILNGFGYMQYLIVAVAGATMALLGVTNVSLTGVDVVTVGMIAAFLTLARSFTQPISQISTQFNAIVTALAGAGRIFAFLDEAPETDQGCVTLVHAKEENGTLVECPTCTGLWAWKQPRGQEVNYIKLEGRVVLDHVDFGYTPEKQILHDITLYAEPGQKIAFVGATGAGKTTITNLINRFYDIDDGKIRYDGININHIKKADLRRSLGVVLQEVHLFSDTVMENIRYGNPDASDEACIRAAELANADGFIRMLPEGYQTLLKGDGSGLSQGQRQLLSIARAAVSNPPVMILDEATSSIDTRTEVLVQDGMDKLMKGRTVFVIAHRLSTIKNADVVMVMDQGRIIERGNHDQLMAAQGMYYQLYTGAFELE